MQKDPELTSDQQEGTLAHSKSVDQGGSSHGTRREAKGSDKEDSRSPVALSLLGRGLKGSITDSRSLTT